jgi:hypothetical protein
MNVTPNTSAMMTWGAIITSALSGCGFLAALLVAYMSKDQANLSLLVGAVVTNFATVVSFWLGSSAGSQKKDEILRGGG